MKLATDKKLKLSSITIFVLLFLTLIYSIVSLKYSASKLENIISKNQLIQLNLIKYTSSLEKKIKRFRFFHTDKRGVGNAILIGIRNAKYSKLISADMDLSTELEFISKADKLLNKFDIVVEPLEDNIYEAIKAGDLPEGRVKKKAERNIFL